MNEERKRAEEMFWRLYLSEATAGLTRNRVIRLAAIATDYPEQALKAALIAETEARG